MPSYKFSSNESQFHLQCLYQFDNYCLCLENDKRAILIVLKDTLKQCNNLEEVLDLLFATDFDKNDDAILAAFEQRIYELQ
jgi:hypothetical protein